MLRTPRIMMFASDVAGRMGRVYQSVRSQPGWVVRFALLAFAMVILLPILLLVMLALVAGIVVFGILAGVNALVQRLRAGLPRDDGRENVRVIQRVD